MSSSAQGSFKRIFGKIEKQGLANPQHKSLDLPACCEIEIYDPEEDDVSEKCEAEVHREEVEQEVSNTKRKVEKKRIKEKKG